VTLAAVTAAIVVGTLDYTSHHEGFWIKLTFKAAEIGTAVLVVDHVAKMIWYRTFIGSFLRWATSHWPWGAPGLTRSDEDLWRAVERAVLEPEGRRRRPAIPRLVESYTESWTVPVVESSRKARFALAHPEPGSASVRAVGSAIGLAGGIVFGGLFVLVPTAPALFSAASERVSAVPTSVAVGASLALVLLFLLFLLMYWRQLLSCLVLLFVVLLCIALALAARAFIAVV
jgi:hypothetical protein